jgi:hypothetical protein
MPIGIRLVYRVKRDRHDFYVYTLLQQFLSNLGTGSFLAHSNCCCVWIYYSRSNIIRCTLSLLRAHLREGGSPSGKSLTCAATSSLTVCATDMATGPLLQSMILTCSYARQWCSSYRETKSTYPRAAIMLSQSRLPLTWSGVVLSVTCG